jgi:hypothetical protein
MTTSAPSHKRYTVDEFSATKQPKQQGNVLYQAIRGLADWGVVA